MKITDDFLRMDDAELDDDIIKYVTKGILYELELDMNDTNFNIMYDCVKENKDIMDVGRFAIVI